MVCRGDDQACSRVETPRGQYARRYKGNLEGPQRPAFPAGPLHVHEGCSGSFPGRFQAGCQGRGGKARDHGSICMQTVLLA